MIASVTVFCSSSRKSPAIYYTAALQLADILIDKDIRIIYGGGAAGLMGCIADRYVERGGRIRGVIPEFMVKVEWAHKHVEDMLVVQNMHERKEKLIEGTDAVIALPGGTGTLEELMEVLALKRLGKFLKPVVLLNTNGFYDPLITLFNSMVSNRFLRPEHLDAYRVVNDPDIRIINRSHVPAGKKGIYPVILGDPFVLPDSARKRLKHAVSRAQTDREPGMGNSSYRVHGSESLQQFAHKVIQKLDGSEGVGRIEGCNDFWKVSLLTKFVQGMKHGMTDQGAIPGQFRRPQERSFRAQASGCFSYFL